MERNLQDKNVTIVGLGRTALALARLLKQLGARPFVTDQADTPKMAGIKKRLDDEDISYETGGHTALATTHADLIVASPGVPWDSAFITTARQRHVPVMGEMEFVFPYCRSKVLAVTGTNGKTTTTELLRHLVESCGESVGLAGNNDMPFSAAVLQRPSPRYLVLEVSSYQLESTKRFRPWIGAILNLTPDHLARHRDMRTYAAVKNRLFAAMEPGDTAVVNADDRAVAGMALPAGVNRAPFSLVHEEPRGLWLDGPDIRFGRETVAHRTDIPLPGRHNVQNALAALTMMRAGGFDWSKTVAGLRTFRGVDHRIEFVVEANGIRYYNDSKSTNIDSLRVALESFDAPLVLIAGGEGKGSDYRELRDLMRRRVVHLITLGLDAPALEQAFEGVTVCERASNMADAVARAVAAARPGQVVLLSPACASFDMYDNFEERGRHFKKCLAECLGSVFERGAAGET